MSSVTTFQVYRNLNNGSWSIRNADTGLIVGHAQTVLLVDAEFIVSEAGRQRVIQEQRKNVHAHIQGKLAMWSGEVFKGRQDVADRRYDITERFTSRVLDIMTQVEVSYNPYKFGHFFDVKNLDKVEQAMYAYFTPEKKVYRGLIL